MGLSRPSKLQGVAVDLDHLRPGLLEPGWQAIGPHPWVLDDVVVDGDDLCVLGQHDSDPLLGGFVVGAGRSDRWGLEYPQFEVVARAAR